MTVTIILAILFVLLIICSAFASASELAFFSLKPADLEAINDSDTTTDRKIMELRGMPDKLLSTILITNNLVNVALVIVSSSLLLRLFDFTGRPLAAFLVETVLITFILLLFGENMPKTYAASNPLRFARISAKPLYVLQKIFLPLEWLLTKPVSVMRRFEKHGGQSITMDDLSQAYEITSDNISEDKEILEGIINFGDINAASAMTPRVDVVAINDAATLEEVIRIINDSEYSRMPVYHEDIDNIVGIFCIKDLIPYINIPDYKWQQLIRKPFFVPQTKHINVLLEDFQKKKTHIAIVVDEFGGTAGIITMEDVLEEIVGEIDDEYDDGSHLYVRQSDNCYLFEAKILLNDFYRIDGIEEEDFEKLEGEAETLAGLILEMQGEIPAKDTEIRHMNYLFKIISVDKRRIKTIKLVILPKDESEKK